MRLLARKVGYFGSIRLAIWSGLTANWIGELLISIAAEPWPEKILVLPVWLLWRPASGLFDACAWATFTLAKGLTLEEREALS